MKKNSLLRIAILKQIALILVLLIIGSIFSTKILAQDAKNHQWTPEDEPSFNHDIYSVNMGFSSWVARQIKYPSKAVENKITGWVHVAYIVDLDGTISNVNVIGSPDTELREEVVKAVKSSPKWMPAKK